MTDKHNIAKVSVLSRLLTSYTPESQDVRTPLSLFHQLNREFKFDLDPCTSSSKPGNLGTVHYYTTLNDGLSQNWHKYRSVFVNPPWAKITPWMNKAYYESLHECTVVVLCPVRSETKWWHTFALGVPKYGNRGCDEIRFIEGRMQFDGHDNQFVIGIALLVFNPDKENRRRSRSNF